MLSCNNIGGRGRYRTADRCCVNPSPTVYGVSHSAMVSANAQLSGCLISALSTMCRAVSACLGTLLAQRGFDRQAIRRRQDASREGVSDGNRKPLRYAALQDVTCPLVTRRVEAMSSAQVAGRRCSRRVDAADKWVQRGHLHPLIYLTGCKVVV